MFPNRVKTLRRTRALTLEQLAEKVGVSPSYLSRIESGQRNISGKLINGLASALEVTPDELIEASGKSDAPIAGSELGRIPVMGTATGAVLGAFELKSEPVDYVRRPPGLANTRDVYAVYVAGTSMGEVHPAGELRLIDPNRPCRPGDSVVVRLAASKNAAAGTYIKLLLPSVKPGVVELMQFNPEAVIAVPADTVETMHKVLTMNEIL